MSTDPNPQNTILSGFSKHTLYGTDIIERFSSTISEQIFISIMTWPSSLAKRTKQYLQPFLEGFPPKYLDFEAPRTSYNEQKSP